jgi:parallel beta-helix repeat protein
MLEQASARMIRPIAALASALLVLGVGSSAHAGTAVARILYVNHANPACSDRGRGAPGRPYCSIKAAAAHAKAGQTVSVAGGVYRGEVTVAASGTRRRPIVFTAAPGATVVVTGRKNGFSISGARWVTVRGFTVNETGGYGIAVSSSSFVKIIGNHVSHAGQPVARLTRSGIWLSETSNSLVKGNRADHNTYAGIYLTNGSTHNEVRANTTFANASVYVRRAPGIRVSQSPANTIDRNITYDNEDSGIECFAGADNTLVLENVSYGNGDHGIDNHQCTGNRVIGNSLYGNVTAGINVEGGSTGTTVANNISIDNAIESPRAAGDIHVDSLSTTGTTVDWNLVAQSQPATLLTWNSIGYTTLSAYQTASGQMLHGIVADPLWVDPAHGDFHLRTGSPAIDSADSSVSGWPATDIQGRPRRDDPATPNTGTGPRSYDDRGAYEYQPPGR